MITKIQSFTDVITNSSSSVFVMKEYDAEYYRDLENTGGCISIERITMDWLMSNPEEVEMVCAMLKVEPSEVTIYTKSSWGDYGWWETPDKDVWETFLELHKDEIEKTFEDLYWVDIEDDFEDAWTVTENAYDDALWSESRH